jgi:NADH dehydrogenase
MAARYAVTRRLVGELSFHVTAPRFISSEPPIAPVPSNFGDAETEPNADERRRLLNFVVVGGGPTGVEMAGAIAELAKRALAADFRSIDPRCARIVLIEAAQRLLPQFSPALSEVARRSLEQLGVEVRLGASVTDCDCSGVSIDNERLQARTIVWAAGVKASPVAEWLDAERDRAGRVKVKADFSAGPSKCFRDRRCRCYNRTGWQAAAGRRARRQAAGILCSKPVDSACRRQNPTRIPLPRPRFYGHNRPQACGRTDRGAQSFGAFCLDTLEFAHIYFLIGFRNRLAVTMNWCWNYVTFQRGTRLITGIQGSRIEEVTPAA